MRVSKKTFEVTELEPDEVCRIVCCGLLGTFNAKTDHVEFHFDSRNEHFIGATVTRTTDRSDE